MRTPNNIRVSKLNGHCVENVIVVVRHGPPRSFTNTVFLRGGNSFTAITGVVLRTETSNSSNRPLLWTCVIMLSSPSLWFVFVQHCIRFNYFCLAPETQLARTMFGNREQCKAMSAWGYVFVCVEGENYNIGLFQELFIVIVGRLNSDKINVNSRTKLKKKNNGGVIKRNTYK